MNLGLQIVGSGGGEVIGSGQGKNDADADVDHDGGLEEGDVAVPLQ